MAHVTEPADFYMLWTKTGHLPRFRHGTREGAMAEAIRLATENPGKKFIVLQAVEKVHFEAEPEAEPQVGTINAQSFGI